MSCDVPGDWSFRIAEEALLKMVQLLGANSYQVHICPGQYILVKEIIISNISPSKAAQRVNSNRSDQSELPNSDDHDAQDADGDDDDDVSGSVEVEGVVNNSKRTDGGDAGIHAKTVSEDANRQASEGMNDISQLECLEDLDVVDDNVDDDDEDDDDSDDSDDDDGIPETRLQMTMMIMMMRMMSVPNAKSSLQVASAQA